MTKISKIKLRYRDRDALFKKEYTELKIKVALNWFEIFALIVVSFFLSYKLVNYITTFDSMAIPIIISLIATAIITYLFCCFRKYQLNITRFDKEHIYKKISNDLIDKTKKGQ